jgi:hypothetical protein
MRFGALILLLIFAVSGISNAQNSDSIDIRGMVKKQIQEAQSKDEQIRNLRLQKQSTQKEVNFISEVINESDTYLVRVLILISFATIVFSFVFIRRIKKRNKIVENNLKRNIYLLREEKFVKKIDPKVRKIRTNLCMKYSHLDHQRKIDNTAKKLNIAKGEIILASRLKNFNRKREEVTA